MLTGRTHHHARFGCSASARGKGLNPFRSNVFSTEGGSARVERATFEEESKVGRITLHPAKHTKQTRTINPLKIFVSDQKAHLLPTAKTFSLEEVAGCFVCVRSSRIREFSHCWPMLAATPEH
jgi:hypothetical protein